MIGCGLSMCARAKQVHEWTPEEKQAFRALAKWSLQNWALPYRTFEALSVELTKRGDEIGYDWNQLIEFDRELLRLAQEGQFLQATIKLGERLLEEVRKHLPDCKHPLFISLSIELPKVKRLNPFPSGSP